MKGIMAAICGTILFTSAASAQNKAGESTQQAHPVPQSSPQPAQSWTTIFSTEARFFAWHNNFVPSDGNTGAGKGSEIYAPFAMQLSGKPADSLNLDFTARGGWVKAVQSTTGRSGEVQTVTDTVVSVTATYLGIQGMQPFVSLNMNLPTGKSALFGTAANARMDPDFVDISTFGEGFNVGPTVGFNFPITGSLLVTTSIGYTWRGKFEQESNLDPFNPFLTNTVNPGDNLTPTVAVNYQTGPLSIGLTGSLTWETPTSVDDLQTFKPGKRYLLALQSSYAWPQQLGATTLSASFARSNRNQVLLPELSALALETLNSNSDVYRIGLQHVIPIGEFQIGPTASYLFRNHNGYNSATLQFVPAKTRWSAGLLAQYPPSPNVTLNARIEHVWTHENENPAIADGKLDELAGGVFPAFTVPPMSGTGWQGSIGINVKL